MTQTNTEQWAVELWRKACHDYGGASIEGSPAEWWAALTIQAAFAEREARLVGALEWYAKDYDHERKCSQWDGGAKARATLAALKDRTQ